MNIEYHPIVEKIKTALSDNGAWFETFEHEAVRTSEEASKVRTGYTLEQGAKALIIRAKIPNEGKKFIMLVMPAHKKFDPAKLKAAFDISDVRFALEPEVAEITIGVLPGGVPPFGNLFGLEVIADQSLFDNEKIIFNAGDRKYSVAMKSADYKRIVDPKVASIT